MQNVITRKAVIQGEVDGKKTSVKYKQCSFQLTFVKESRACPVSKTYEINAMIFAVMFHFWTLFAICGSYSCPPILHVALPDREIDRDLLEMPSLCKQYVLSDSSEDIILIIVLLDGVFGKEESSTVIFEK